MEPVSDLRPLYRAHKGRVEYLEVPELNYFVLAGEGAPEDEPFAEAADALFAVSAAAHFVVRRRAGTAGRPMPLEALWWTDATPSFDLLAAVALGVADVRLTDRRTWRWQAMVVQPPEVDEAAFEQAVLIARKKELPRVDEIRLATWREGRVAQVLHLGSYAEAARAVTALHDTVEAAGHHLTGRHHEIYLRDPRRAPRDRLRMVLRRPVVPA